MMMMVRATGAASWLGYQACKEQRVSGRGRMKNERYRARNV
jgi:hypothetical protein